MLDEFAAATFSGFPVSAIDTWEIESMNGYELCQKAEEMGIDLRELGVLRPPQSFQYIDTDMARRSIGVNEHVVTTCSRDSSS